MDNYLLEFKSYLEGLNNQLKSNESAKELYYGFYVFDGKIIQNPDILFIGINPGKGAGLRDYNVVIEEGERISYLDVYDEGYPYYTLAENTIDFLKDVGKSEKEIIEILEKKSLKMNLKRLKTTLQK